MPEKSCCSRICRCLTSSIVLIVTGYLLWHFLGRPSAQDARDFIDDFDFGDFTDVLSDLTDRDWLQGFNEDPHVGDNSTNAWATSGEGLTLELQNALDDTWTTEFEVAVADWQESDVLTLTTTTVEVDHSCQHVRGVMKVCNGNFGDTGWMGINEVLMEGVSDSALFIVSSVAKMNEYYLLNAPHVKRQYTMCHEIGHGFGLPHTDENPYNADLGNCLDYTNTPENNMHPGEMNFERLRSIYLRDYNPASNIFSGTTVDSGGDVDDDENGGTRRVLHTYYLWNH